MTAVIEPKKKTYRKDLPKTGEWVFWYASGNDNHDPAPAMVLRNVDGVQMVANLEIHLPGGILYRDSVHHMDMVQTAPKKLVTNHGGWAWEHPLRPETHKK